MLLTTLLFSFLQIGLFSIGGGYAIIPLIQQQVVNNHGWLTLKEFTDIITISQMTPGPLAVNTSTFVGIRVAGLLGALLATFGCIISGFIISVSLYRVYQRFQNNRYMLNTIEGLKATSVGLIGAAACTILSIAFFTQSAGNLFSQLNWVAVSLFGGSLLLLRKFKMNPILLIVLTGVAGVILY